MVTQVRVDPEEPDDEDADLILDIYGPRVRAANVQWDSRHTDFLKGLAPSVPAQDFLRLAMAAYCIDKLCSRANATDAWTRELDLRLPVWHRRAFDQQADLLGRAMSFLSGDRWRLSFRDHPTHPPLPQEHLLPADVTSVALLSGGLDSLAGAIDQLTAGDHLVFVSHADAGITPKRQTLIVDALTERFGRRVVSPRRFLLRPQGRAVGLHHPLPADDREVSTRARSLLFIAAGIAVASALGDTVPLVVPENGFIGINVPLTGARAGSLSTRTTHPHFLELLGEALAGIGLCNGIHNPYRLLTKGEVLARSADPDLLRRLAAESLSCSHPEALRHKTKLEGNCGYCWPCIIRRASMHHVGWDATEDYIVDVLSGVMRRRDEPPVDIDLWDPKRKRGADLRAAVASLHEVPTPFTVLRNGPVPVHEVDAFSAVHRRGRTELLAWLRAEASGTLRARLP
jgi:7-cyano-7-deazaguanine synthase in queuosine biosynthesis